jgi:outer membrane protein assembly factor BamB
MGDRSLSRRTLLQTASAGVGGLVLGEFALTPGHVDATPRADASVPKVPPTVSTWSTQLSAEYAYVDDVEDGVAGIIRSDKRITALDVETGEPSGTVETNAEEWPDAAVTDGVVYDISPAQVSVADVESGATWERSHSLDSTPTLEEVTESRVFLANGTRILGYDRTTGREVLQYAAGDDAHFGTEASLLTVESSRRHAVLDVETGDLLYESAAPDGDENRFEVRTAGDRIGVYDDGTALGLSSEGREAWRRELPDAEYVTDTAERFVLAVDSEADGRRLDVLDVETGTTVASAAAAVDHFPADSGVAYVDEGAVGLLDPANDSVEWERQQQGRITAAGLDVTAADPSTEYVVVQTQREDDARLVAYDAAFGEQRWSVGLDEPFSQFSFLALYGSDASYLVGDGRLVRLSDSESVAVTEFDVDPSGDDLFVFEEGPYAYVETGDDLHVTDVRTGRVLATFEGDPVGADAGHRTLVDTGDALVGYDPATDERWRRGDLPLGEAGEVTDFGRTVIVTRTDESGSLYVLDRETGETTQTLEGDAEYLSNDGSRGPEGVRVLYDDSTLWLLKQQGTIARVLSDLSDTVETAALVNETLLIATAQRVHAIDVVDASKRWSLRIDEDASIDVDGERLYVGGSSLSCRRVSDGELLWYEATTTEDGYLSAAPVGDVEGTFVGGSRGIVRVAPPERQVAATITACRALRDEIEAAGFPDPATDAMRRARSAASAERYAAAQAALSRVYERRQRALDTIDRWQTLAPSYGVGAALDVVSDSPLTATERALERGDYAAAADALDDLSETRRATLGVAGVLGAVLGYVASTRAGDATSRDESDG